MQKHILRAILPTLSADDLVKVILDTEDPYFQALCSIGENDKERLNDIVEDADDGIQILLDATAKGDYKRGDKYLVYFADPRELFSFSEADTYLDRIGIDCICEYLCETLEDSERECYETAWEILCEGAKRLINELTELIGEGKPCEMELLED